MSAGEGGAVHGLQIVAVFVCAAITKCHGQQFMNNKDVFLAALEVGFLSSECQHDWAAARVLCQREREKEKDLEYLD